MSDAQVSKVDLPALSAPVRLPSPIKGSTGSQIVNIGGTPDWNANEGEKGYIEGRTHYVDEEGIVHKLPNKFIDADWMATKQDGGAGKTVFIPEQTVSGSLWNTPMQNTPVEGDAYAVEVNGVLYKCVCRNDGDGTLYLGNGSLLGDTTTAHNNEPFCIAWFSGATTGTFYTDGTLEAPIGIKVTNWQDVVYNKLPEEYLPENVVKGEGGKVGWDNVSDKPFSQDAGELLFSTTVTFATDEAAKAGTSVSANNLSLVNKAEYWLEINGDMVKCRCESSSGFLWNIYDAENNLRMKRQMGYIFIYGQTAGTFTYNLYGLSENIVLDPQYIPSNIARKQDIPNVGGGVKVAAEVGQTIRVKAVDAEGNPTEWEAADYQPRTHWTEIAELLPNTPAIVSDGAALIQGVDFQFVVGVTYTINWNGTPYTCVAVDGGGGYVGNTALMGGTGDTGEPFVATVMDGMLFAIPLDGSTEVTIGVSGDRYQKINKNYLPEDTVYGDPVYTKPAFDLGLWFEQECQESFITSKTNDTVGGEDIWVNMATTTNDHWEKLIKIFQKYLLLFGNGSSYEMTTGIHTGDDLFAATRGIVVGGGSGGSWLAVEEKRLLFRWSDTDNCIQRSCVVTSRASASATVEGG